MAGVGAASAGVAALTTEAVNSYADYEQLVGGIETLFGTGGMSVQEYADKVGKSVRAVQSEYNMLMEAQTTALENADNAYKNAGMSANEYMETVTSFAASLKQSTKNEVEAAEVANQAIIDMADNANKMGSSMESIQNAYQGFAKQNYTMLDNLKLGYGGTKEEMARLLADATELSGIEYNIDNLSDVYSAIHVIQEELGIAGTTSKEASSTISGSLATMKSAWSNLLTGMADENADLDGLINNFVDSTAVAVDNLLPRIEVALNGVAGLIDGLAPVLAEKLPDIIVEVLPGLIEAGVSIVTSLVYGIEENLPVIVEETIYIVELLVNTLLEMLPLLMEMGIEVIIQLALGIAGALPELVPTIVAVVLQMVDTLINNADLLVDAAIALIFGLADGLIAALPTLIDKVPEIVIKLVDAFVSNAGTLAGAAVELIFALGAGLIASIPTLLENVPEIMEALLKAFTAPMAQFMEIGTEIVSGLWDGLSQGWDWLTGKVSELAGSLLDAAKDTLDINSPSKEFSYIGKMCVAGFDEGSEDLFDEDGMTKNINASLDTMKSNNAGTLFGESNSNTNCNVAVYLEGETKEVFRVVRVENDDFIRTHGYNPLAK